MTATETLAFVCESGDERLDVFLAARCDGMSRSRIRRLIDAGHVLADGERRPAGFKPKAGAVVTVRTPPPTPPAARAQDIPITAVYEDAALIIVDKPAGMPVHRGAGHPDGTLVNALLGMDKRLSQAGGDALRPGIVHRLDKDTSGLMMVAKTDAAHAALSEQLRARTVEKVYLALVEGAPRPARAAIDAPIGRDPCDRKRMAITDGGRDALTRYAVLRIAGGRALMEVRPKTGRTHQIRVHLAAIGHPVIGDALYGTADARLGRHFLHAARLGFDHPTTGERMRFESPLPSELADALGGLGGHHQSANGD